MQSPLPLLQCSPHCCFDWFVQNFADAHRKRDQQKESTNVGQTLNLVGNCSYGHQKTDRSRHMNAEYVKRPHVISVLTTSFSKALNEFLDQI